VRLFTRNGNEWTERYPLIVEAALRNRASSFVIDGEAVLLGVDGVSDFNGLHSRRHDDEVQLYAFDILALEGEDLMKLPLAGATTGRDFCQRFRTRRDRPRPISPRLQIRPRGHGVKTPRQPLSRRPIAALDQGQKPQSSGAEKDARRIPLNSNRTARRSRSRQKKPAMP
jgi:hypothetical protein